MTPLLVVVVLCLDEHSTGHLLLHTITPFPSYILLIWDPSQQSQIRSTIANRQPILHFMLKRLLNQIKMTSILHTLLHYLRIVLNYISSFFFDHQHGGGRSGGGGDGGIVGLTSFFFGRSYQKKLLTFDNGLQGM